MTVNCPNCGKPVRQGAKYCGFCRAELPANLAASTAEPPAPGDATIPGGKPCPNCGTLVRTGARFCPKCGMQMQPAGASVVPRPQTAAPPASQPIATPLPPPASSGDAPARPRSTPQSILLILILAALCFVVGAAVTIFTKDTWQPILAQKLTETTPSAPSATPGSMLTNTPATPTPTPTKAKPTSTVTPTNTPVPTTTGTQPSTGDLFHDDVSASPAASWHLMAWGSPAPRG